MRELETLVLCKERTPRVDINVRAEIENGCLTIYGQDFGNAVEERFGRDEYEYVYSFDERNTELLMELLTSKTPDIKKAFIDEFGGADGCMNLRRFCETNKIEYEFWSWP
ncbi:MAG: hypothetical protein FWC29_06055 [Methanomassiliicoccaceae archaeon]|nr:hypothetical protein [Methanomassiliicoccaceae archaeon]